MSALLMTDDAPAKIIALSSWSGSPAVKAMTTVEGQTLLSLTDIKLIVLNSLISQTSYYAVSIRPIGFLVETHVKGYTSFDWKDLSTMEQRRHERVRVELPASFSGSSSRGEGTILNLSVMGCRARSPFAVKKDDCLGVLIDIPKYERPLYVSRAWVRWSEGRDFGMEFIEMELEDQQRLGETIRTIDTGAGSETGPA